MSLVKIRAALETAYNAMDNVVLASDIIGSSTGAPAIFVCSQPHNLAADATKYKAPSVNVSIAGHVGSNPDLNGSYIVVPQDAMTFSLLNIITKAAINTNAGGSGGTVRANLTAWENISFPTNNPFPWERVNLIFAKPENPSYGGIMWRELGFMQVTLNYPISRGSASAMSRADLIRSTFPRGASFSNGGVVVNIMETAEIRNATIVDENYVVPVRIPFKADIFA